MVFKLLTFLLKRLIIMERKEFLNLVGISVGAVILQNCMSGCTKAADPTPAVIPPVTPPTGGGTNTVSGLTGNNSLAKGAIDFTVDITKTDFEALKTNGQAVVTGDVIIARTKTGDFIVVEKACTHQGTTVDFVADNSTFKCSNHGSVFDSSGNVTVSPAAKPLKKYSAAFDTAKNMLKVI
jgi:cytochrome b6-f complex iron-sulfur subunit